MSLASVDPFDVSTPYAATFTLTRPVTIADISLHIFKLDTLDGDFFAELRDGDTDVLLASSSVLYSVIEGIMNNEASYHGTMWFEFATPIVLNDITKTLKVVFKSSCTANKVEIVEDHEMNTYKYGLQIKEVR